MSINDREVLEGLIYQGEDESISYTLDVSAIGNPSSPSVVVKDVDGDSVVTATVMPVNSPTVNGATVQLSPLTLLTAGRLYRVEVKYTVAGNVLESYFYVQAQE